METIFKGNHQEVSSKRTETFQQLVSMLRWTWQASAGSLLLAKSHMGSCPRKASMWKPSLRYEGMSLRVGDCRWTRRLGMFEDGNSGWGVEGRIGERGCIKGANERLMPAAGFEAHPQSVRNFRQHLFVCPGLVYDALTHTQHSIGETWVQGTYGSCWACLWVWPEASGSARSVRSKAMWHRHFAQYSVQWAEGRWHGLRLSLHVQLKRNVNSAPRKSQTIWDGIKWKARTSTLLTNQGKQLFCVLLRPSV